MKLSEIKSGDTLWVMHRNKPIHALVLRSEQVTRTSRDIEKTLVYIEPSRGSVHKTTAGAVFKTRIELETMHHKGVPRWLVFLPYGMGPRLEKVTLFTDELGNYSDRRSYARWQGSDDKFYRAYVGHRHHFFLKTKKEALQLLGKNLPKYVRRAEGHVEDKRQQLVEALGDLAKVKQLVDMCKKAKVGVGARTRKGDTNARAPRNERKTTKPRPARAQAQVKARRA